MAESQLFYLATNRYSFISSQKASLVNDWSDPTEWQNVKSPSAASTTTITYNTTSQNVPGAAGSWLDGDGKAHFGTVVPAPKVVTRDGVDYTITTQYQVRGYTVYSRTTALTKKKKMQQKVYNNTTKPLQIRMRSNDKFAQVIQEYSTLEGSVMTVFFADHYKDDDGQIASRDTWLPHPNVFELSYGDVRKNMDTQNANNSDNRDNKGSYILSNVRANVVTLNMSWQGLTADEGKQLLAVLNPDLSNGNNRPYINAQFLSPEAGVPVNKTFFAGDRKVLKYPNGTFKEISVTLTEV